VDHITPDGAPVAAWEFTSLAIMLIATYGDDAEAHAQDRLDEARRSGNAGERVTWIEVVKRLPDVRVRHADNG
jgi:hypothetical protein